MSLCGVWPSVWLLVWIEMGASPTAGVRQVPRLVDVKAVRAGAELGRTQEPGYDNHPAFLFKFDLTLDMRVIEASSRYYSLHSLIFIQGDIFPPVSTTSNFLNNESSTDKID